MCLSSWNNIQMRGRDHPYEEASGGQIVLYTSICVPDDTQWHERDFIMCTTLKGLSQMNVMEQKNIYKCFLWLCVTAALVKQSR